MKKAMKSSSALKFVKFAQRLDFALLKVIALKSEKVARSLDGPSRRSQNPKTMKRIIIMRRERAELTRATGKMKSTNQVIVVVTERGTSALAIPSLSMAVIVEVAMTVILATSTSRERHEKNLVMMSRVIDGILLRVLLWVLELLSYCVITARRKGTKKAAAVVV